MKKELKREYESIKIPDSLNDIVDDAIIKGLSKPKKFWTISKTITSVAAVFCIVFVTMLNTSKMFATAINNVPFLGRICRVFTFQEYNIEDKTKTIKVRMPQIENAGNTKLEKRINMEISKIINEEVKNSKIRAEEYFEAFVTIGGREEDFIPIEVEFDYEIKSSNDKYVSFLITKFETLASAYQEQYFYNIDLENGRILTLKDCFGPDYKNIVTHEVNKGISNLDKDMNFYLFKDVDIKDLITTDSAFYINEDNEIIVVFNKYEIAAGAAGMFEFPVGKIS
ncbi:MAG: DUF3298 domain-containing protein [Acutalibacteraceae bacterium]|nr:DUF3298 and DUF4163 domain-containing protein [Clostridiales bacterium]